MKFLLHTDTNMYITANIEIRHSDVIPKMTWILMHNNENVGEWSDDLVNEVVEKLKKSISKSEKKIAQNESLSVISEFLPDPIRDTLSG